MVLLALTLVGAGCGGGSSSVFRQSSDLYITPEISKSGQAVTIDWALIGAETIDSCASNTYIIFASVEDPSGEQTYYSTMDKRVANGNATCAYDFDISALKCSATVPGSTFTKGSEYIVQTSNESCSDLAINYYSDLATFTW